MSGNQKKILVGDIGGTNCRLGIFDPITNSVDKIRVLPTQEVPGVVEAIKICFQDELEMPNAAVIAGAGPAVGGRVHLTNVPEWEISSLRLQEAFGFKSCRVVNDMTAFAAGVAAQPTKSLPIIIGSANEVRRKSLVVTLGTGLGLAWVVWQKTTPVIISAEAGNTTFAPETHAERSVVDKLSSPRCPVIVEDVLSGTALPKVADALFGNTNKTRPISSAELVNQAADDPNSSAAEVLRFVCAALGGFLRNALLFIAGADEVVLGGGFGRKITTFLPSSDFGKRLATPSRTGLNFENMPVRLAARSDIALLGAGYLGGNRIHEVAQVGIPRMSQG